MHQGIATPVDRNWLKSLGFAVCTLMTVGVIVMLPTFAPSPMMLHVCIMIALAMVQGTAWNILGGYSGQHSIGHAAYFGVGAYAAMMSSEIWHTSVATGMGLAAVCALALALVLGTITFRLRGPYFVLASISTAEIIRLGALEAKGFTRGAEGILLTSTPSIELGSTHIALVSKVPYFYATVGLAAVAVLVCWGVERSKLGYYLQAIREDQDAAHSLGINPTLYKNVALAISSVLTAWSGGLWALYVKFLDPNLAFGIDVSVQMVLVAIIGGMGTLWGPVIGAVVLALLSETLRNPKWLVAIDLVDEDSGVVAFIQHYLASSHVLFYGLLLVLVILFAKDGILGLIRKSPVRTSWRVGVLREGRSG